MRRASTRGMEQTGDLATSLSEALDGRRIVKAYGLEEHVADRAHGRLARCACRRCSKLFADAPRPFLPPTFFAGLVIAATLFYAGYQARHGTLGFNNFSAFLAAMLLAQTAGAQSKPALAVAFERRGSRQSRVCRDRRQAGNCRCTRRQNAFRSTCAARRFGRDRGRALRLSWQRSIDKRRFAVDRTGRKNCAGRTVGRREEHDLQSPAALLRCRRRDG